MSAFEDRHRRRPGRAHPGAWRSRGVGLTDLGGGRRIASTSTLPSEVFESLAAGDAGRPADVAVRGQAIAAAKSAWGRVDILADATFSKLRSLDRLRPDGRTRHSQLHEYPGEARAEGRRRRPVFHGVLGCAPAGTIGSENALHTLRENALGLTAATRRRPDFSNTQ